MNSRCQLACLLFATLILIACKKDSPKSPAPLAGSGGSTGVMQDPVQQPAAGSPAAVAGRAAPAGAGGSAGSAGAPAAGSGGMPAAGAPAAGSGGAGASGSAGMDAGSGGMAGGAAGTAGGAGSGGAAGSGMAAGACTGKPGKLRGKSSQMVMAPGARTFVYYAPATLDPNKPAPLVFVPHGYTLSGETQASITKYADLADREGFVVIFPDGAPGSVGPWDVGSGVCGLGSAVPGSGDDQMFIDEMIEFAAADQCIDKEHMFMSGWSMGGYLSHHSGCLREDIRAIGPHSGGTHDLSGCKVARKPVIIFHFDPDALIEYNCALDARDRWVRKNGCSAANPDVTMVKGGQCEYYKDCPADGQVALCTFQIPANHASDLLPGHAWSGGSVQTYSISETESAAELGWSFFKKYAW